MNTLTRSALALMAAAFAGQAAADITLYDREDYRGRNFTTGDPRIENIGDTAASIAISDGRMREVCDDINFRGWCMRLQPGNYPTLQSMGMRNRIASVRVVNDVYRSDRGQYSGEYRGDGRDYRRRSGERLYDADVVQVRAVMGADEQRCWVEREQVRSPNVGGAVAGAIIGGILGHQIGHGGGRDAATVGGAVVGGAIGANVNSPGAYQDVQRCSTVPSTQAPAFWDVTYIFRGQEHRVQMSTPPGTRITVNEYGEPRA